VAAALALCGVGLALAMLLHNRRRIGVLASGT
jgi:hypothetical protein